RRQGVTTGPDTAGRRQGGRPRTCRRHTYSLRKHILPEFGPMRVVDILPEHVRAWVARLREEGISSGTINANKAILSAVFTTALNDQVTFVHPCEGSSPARGSQTAHDVRAQRGLDRIWW